jgi:hypothetical protein
MSKERKVVWVGLLVLLWAGAAQVKAAAAATAPIRRLVLEEQRIEGKIRRPQLVLIKAEQRPVFASIVVHSAAGVESIARAVSKKALEASPFSGAFRFVDKKIANIVP